MRKILGLCFTVMVLVCVFCALEMPAYAETYITQVEVSGVTPAVVGEMPTTEGIVCSDENVTVEANWYRYSYPDGGFFAFSGPFREGEIYKLELDLMAADGYYFDWDILNAYTVNGGKADEETYYWASMIGFDMYYFTRDVELLDTAQILSMPTLTPGQPMAMETFRQQIRIPEDANYRISRIDVRNMDYTYADEVMEELFYHCAVYLAPKEGYWWDTENIQCQVPEVNQGAETVDPGYILINMVVDARQVVETLTVTIPTPQPGDAATLEGITVDGGVPVQEESGWVNVVGHQPVQVLEDDQVYQLHLYIKAPEDHRYQEGVTQLQVNGMTLEHYYMDEDWFSVYGTVDFRKQAVTWLDLKNAPEYVEPGPVPGEQPTMEHVGAVISQFQWLDDAGNPVTQLEQGKQYVLEVTFQAKEGYKFQETTVRCNQQEYMPVGDMQTVKVAIPYTPKSVIKDMSVQVEEAVVGEKIAELGITTPDEKPYTLSVFFDDETDDHWDVEDVFEQGHLYRLYLEFTANEGYRFSREYQPLINGKTEGSWRVATDGSIAQLILEINFLYPVEKVELPAFPELKPGDTVDQSTVEPEGANYLYAARWVVFQGESETVVEDKGQYLFYYSVVPAQGYGFTEDTVFTVGGVPVQPLQLYSHAANLIKYYSIGYEKIDSVALELPPIEIGEKPGELQAPEAAPYRVDVSMWGANASGDYQKPWEDVETYQEGYYHYLQVRLCAAEGFVFDYPPEVTVNGKKAQLVEREYLFGEVILTIGFGKLTDSIPGDADGDGDVDVDDAIYLLQHVLMPEQFPVEGELDVDGSGAVTVDDAIYLLQHVLMPEQFPLK